MRGFRRVIPVGALLLVAAGPATSTAPATRPGEELRCGEHAARFEVVQNGVVVAADGAGVYHLRAGPFAIRIQGDVGDFGMAASHNDGLAKAIAAEKGPVITLVASNAAYEKGSLLVDDLGTLARYETYKEWFKDDAGAYAKLLKGKLGSVPVALDSMLQYPTAYAPDGATDYTHTIDTLQEADRSLFAPDTSDHTRASPPVPTLEWGKQGELFLTLFVTAPIDGELFERVSARSVQLRFDGK